MADPYSRFLIVFVTYTQPGEWITPGALANRIMPRASRDFRKEVSRKLSNLNRFGHLERRRENDRSPHEYRRQPNVPVVLPPEFMVVSRPRQIVLTLPDPRME